ncbi:GTP-binding protein putative [Entamoeba histolytica]|uniref:Protein SEY1 homolog 2 n=3 Tax=Entamoeba histolytica TaxID=5759 RepID=SEY12_ENTH1|nr:GTP-binding protein, putative [Entamoeba histolytica HM-1:IMSS]C4M6U3.1 RecName: Full=Protein SEY1 homolog 2 [Entamoeba histolytica HM-1:IMSS]EAL44464.2 GTP-binding protein, putative [Entamoeba histolytica HM-1:IMSS]EMD48850.1 GTP-binding protein, putative [Entamoeba histolytica KU27]GAT97219.1 GTP-binding protein putative [Entamoeba histolytica]|eukprot:XP_649850.2 GTP-binding protein, putative [Entamoeba histolytica HM-1:IMSS]
MDEVSPTKHFTSKPLLPTKTPRDKAISHYVNALNSPRNVVKTETPECGIQIIDGDGNFASTDTRERPSLKNYILSKPEFLKRGMDYNAVGILGAQSSGKSTLLNYLFNTKFRILNEVMGRSRTTHGVWMALSGKESNIVVFDLEGTDGSAREDDYSFERKTSLFSLSVCSVLMVNLWSHDVGRFQASNMSLLKTVFELNLQLFVKEETPKTLIVFVIRDREADTPFDQIERDIMEDIMRIWDTVIPPEEFINSPINRFFDFQFTSLPHYEHFYENFVEEVNLMKKKFDPKNKDTYFLPQYNKEIPADGLSCFCEQIWETIKDNKDLDLPSQREMLSRYRCTEISNQIYKEFNDSIKGEMKILKKGNIIEDFKKVFTKQIDAALERYKEVTERYMETIVEEIEEQLKKQLCGLVESLFERQAELMEKAIGKRVKGEFTIIRNEYALLYNKKEFNPMKYQKYSQELSRTKAVIERDWRKQFDDSVPKFLAEKTKEKFNSVCKDIGIAYEDSVSKMTEVMKQHFGDYLESTIKPKITPYLEACKKDMWKNIRNVINIQFTNGFNKLEEGFKTCSNMNKDTIEEEIKKSKTDILNSIKELVIKRKIELPYLLERKFNNMFRFDNKGLPRKWEPTDDVDTLYFAARDETEDILDMYCYFRIEESDDQYKFTINYRDGDLPSESIETLPKGADEEKVILNHEERKELIETLNGFFEKGYLIALREKENSEIKYQIPLYLIVLVVFFGFDEFIAILTNPLLFILTLIIGGGVYIGYKLNLGGVAKNYIQYLLSMSLSSTMEYLRTIPFFTPLIDKVWPKDDNNTEETQEEIK